ncbi:YbdD/YjiX family protein [Streptomyces sp. NPDC057638]|uniref:YbdD/YjiX family protein n=1 Tax=Streptomyces sp. NPDC057638 TaxID=3346190 RepID=UPI0036BCB435
MRGTDAASVAPGTPSPPPVSTGTDHPGGHRTERGTAAGALAAVGRGLRSVHRYLRELTGETAYERYCAWLLRERPGATPPSRREFERARLRRQEEAPGSRCC